LGVVDDPADVFSVGRVEEEDFIRVMPFLDYGSCPIVQHLLREVPLGVDDQLLLALQCVLEEGVAAGEGHAVIAAFDYQLNSGG